MGGSRPRSGGHPEGSDEIAEKTNACFIRLAGSDSPTAPIGVKKDHKEMKIGQKALCLTSET